MAKLNQTAIMARANTQRDNLRGKLESMKKTGNKKACYTIVCLYNDSEEIKLTGKDSRIDKFNDIFGQALEMKPDAISVKVYQGEGANAIEDVESSIIIRLKERDMQPQQHNLGNIAQPAHESPNAFEKRLLDQEWQIKMQQQANEHGFAIRDKDVEIKELLKIKNELEKEIAEYKEELGEFQKKFSENEHTGVISASTIVKGGLLAAAELAKKNPDGKLLGLIPNRALLGFIGFGGESANELPENTQQNNERTTYIDQVSAYLQTLTDEDFEKIYAIFSYMATDNSRIAMMYDMIQSPPNRKESV